MAGKHCWNRRQWISAAAAAAGAAAIVPGRGFASLGRVFGNPASGPVRDAVDTKLNAFPLSQVRLRRGIFLEQLESNRRDWEGYTEPARREAALQRFHAYAFQWY